MEFRRVLAAILCASFAGCAHAPRSVPKLGSIIYPGPSPAGGGSSSAVAQGSATSGQVGGLTQGATTSAAPTYSNATTNPLSLDTAGALRVNVTAGSAGGPSTNDNTAFTQGATPTAPAGFILDEVAGAALTENNAAAARIDSKRAQIGVLEDATTRGQRASVSASGALKTDGSASTQPVSGTVTANAGSGTFAVSAASLPLPSGASTAAKQPALGTAGAASADVITVQGIASMTALKTDGSGVTQPISGTVTANAGTNLNTSALATSANQTTIGSHTTKINDGTNTAAVKAASTAAVAADPALVMSISPNTALPTGANTIGALTANQSVNVAQMNGVATTMGAGATGTGTQRVDANLSIAGVAVSSGTGASGTGTVRTDSNVSLAGVAASAGNGISGTGVQRVTIASDSTGALTASQPTVSTATVSSTTASITSVTVIASNAARKGAMCTNDSTAVAFLKFGSTASATSYTVRLISNAYYELPNTPIYTGIVTGIWTTATGSARCTEVP